MRRRGLISSFGLWVAGAVLWTGALAAQNVSEQYLLAAANQERAANGLQPLRVDEHLALAARLHAYQMAEHGTISHQFEGEPELATRAGDSGAHFSLITENVAEAPNSARIHDMWMQSEGHRANLLDANVDSVGIAVVQQHGQLYAVEDFARTVAQLSLSQQEATVANLLTAAGLTLGGNTGDARQTCTMKAGFVGSRQPWFVMRYTASSLDKLPPELSARLATGKYHQAVVGACVTGKQTPFTSYNLAVMLFP
jgi:hypothetical protein